MALKSNRTTDFSCRSQFGKRVLILNEVRLNGISFYYMCLSSNDRSTDYLFAWTFIYVFQNVIKSSQHINPSKEPYITLLSILSFIVGNCELLFYFKIVLAILDLLNFHMNFRVGLSISTKKPARVLRGIAFNLWTYWKSTAIITILSFHQRTWSVFPFV